MRLRPEQNFFGLGKSSACHTRVWCGVRHYTLALQGSHCSCTGSHAAVGSRTRLPPSARGLLYTVHGHGHGHAWTCRRGRSAALAWMQMLWHSSLTARAEETSQPQVSVITMEDGGWCWTRFSATGCGGRSRAELRKGLRDYYSCSMCDRMLIVARASRGFYFFGV